MNNFPKPYQLYQAFHAGYTFETYFDGKQWWNVKTGQPVDGNINDDRLYDISEQWLVSFVDMYGVTITQKVGVVVDLPVCREHEPERWKKSIFAKMRDDQWAAVRAHFHCYWNTSRVAPHVRYGNDEWLKHMYESLRGRKRTAVIEPILVEIKEIQ
jgi:hypothetical protein